MVNARWIPALCALLTLVGQEALAQPQSKNSREVRTQDLMVQLSPDGQVTAATFRDEKTSRSLQMATRLAGAVPSGEATLQDLGQGGWAFQRMWTMPGTSHSCTVTDRFLPQPSSIRWEIEIQGQGEPWSVPIETTLSWPTPASARFWTAWGQPPSGKDQVWSDPLVPEPFCDLDLFYGGTTFWKTDGFALPLVCVMEKASDLGLTVVQSPKDLLLDLGLKSTSSGEITLSRKCHRICKDQPVRFTLEILVHEADPRCALGAMANLYSDFLWPHNPLAQDVAGCGGYSCYEGELPVAKLHAMAFRTNWKASFDFPYMGMFLPPVSDEETWTSFRKTTTSIPQLKDYSKRMRQDGFHVLNYFNVTEFGSGIQIPAPPAKGLSDKDLWRDANEFLYQRLPRAILPNDEGKPIPSWEMAVAMDPGDPAYQAFLLDQARKHIDLLPDSSGICIDRMDWLTFYNGQADDGVSWRNGKPCRSLVTSWHEIMTRLGPMMHEANKVIFANPHTKRLDLMDEVDGIYDEFGHMGHSLNLCAFLSLVKPNISWTAGPQNVLEDPDGYFQRQLYMGAFPTAPVQGNDHCITPDPELDAVYLDYGPLLACLRGRQWILEPLWIEIVEGSAKINMFSIPEGILMPVTFAGEARTVTIETKGNAADAPPVECLHPGDEEWDRIRWRPVKDGMQLQVPVKRGCAMVRWRHAWIEPEAETFLSEVEVSLGTLTKAREIRYTLDGSQPTSDSFLYTTPFVLNQTTRIRMAVYRESENPSALLDKTYVKTRVPSPAVFPLGGLIRGSVEVNLNSGIDSIVKGARIRFTRDGSEPTEDSPRYKHPFKLSETTTVKARTFVPGTEPSLVATAVFSKPGPTPALPEEPLDRLSPVKSSVGWGDQAKINRSIQGNPLHIADQAYDQGLGVHANSEVVYELKQDYASFVAVVGVDDEMKAFKRSSVVFQVFADETCLHTSPKLRLGDTWPIQVDIPQGSKRLRLVLTDAGDGIDGDHADWARAGFLVKRK